MRKLILAFLLLSGHFTPAQSYFDSTWTTYFRLNDGGWTAGDATISVSLPDGRVMWLFGDSYTVPVQLNNTLPCLFQVRNCFMVQDSVDRSHFRTILDSTQTGVNQTTFKLALNDTTLFWPGAGYVREDTVFIFLERYSNTTLQYYGCYIAKLTYPQLQQVGIYKANDDLSAIFGRAVVVDEIDGKLYIYGNKLNWIVHEPVLARCDITNPLGQWEYYNVTAWTNNPSEMEKISQEPVSPGFSVFKYNEKVIMVTQENGYLECGLGREIYSMESDFLYGPFGNKKLLYTEESKFEDRYLLTYNAQAHPWAIENNELLISYNVNDRFDTIEPYVCPSQCLHIFTDRMDADTYRPKFIRVPMEMIVSSGSDTEPEFRIKVIPNPVTIKGNAEVTFTLLASRVLVLTTYDPAGRIINNIRVEGRKGVNKIWLHAPSVPGLYFLKMKSTDGAGIVKFVVK